MTTVDPKNAVAMQAARVLAEQRFIDPEGYGDFLDWVYIYEPPQVGLAGSGGKVKFQKWDHLMELAGWLDAPWQKYERGEPVELKERQGVLGKCRRRGFSWLVAAYGAWLIFKRMSAVSLFFSSQEGPSIDLLDKAAFIYKNLPEQWQLPIIKGKDGVGGGEFILSDNSRILAFPSTSKAGRSYSGTFVFMDEAEHHDFIADAMLAVKPITDTGGQLLMGSTINKRRAVSVFRNTYVNAEKLEYTKFFIPYGTRAHETPEYYEKLRNSIDESDLEDLGLSRDLYMEQEWPRSEEEMLSASKVLAFFDMDMLKALEAYVQKPLERIPGDEFPQDFREIMNFWVRRTPRGKYAAGTDVAHGVNLDYSITAVIDLASWRVVADVVTNRHEPDDFAEASMDMLGYYQNPIWGIEDNEWGILVIKAAENRTPKYPRLYHRETMTKLGGVPSKQQVPGWHTDSKSRWILWGELKLLVDPGELIIPSREGIMQFQSVIKDNQKDGRPAAKQGAHDDYPVAVGIAYQMRKYAHSVKSTVVARAASFTLG